MKKNTMMRVASVLLVAVLLSTSVISGTFAKYVTSDSGSDTARVAKWGIVLDVNGSLFDKNYMTADNTPTSATTGISVQSSTNDKVVAPGTKNTDGMTFSIKGTAETSAKVEIKLQESQSSDNAPKDIFLAAGTYRDWTVAGQNDDYSGSFTVPSGNYYPVVFTLVETYGEGTYSIKGAADEITNGSHSNRWSVAEGTNTVTVTGTLADMNALFTALTNKMTAVAPNYKFDNTFKLTWEWAFEDGTNAALYNKADTLLGNLIAGTGSLANDTVTFANVSNGTGPDFTAMTANTDYNLNTGFYFSISVTQVD